MWTMSESALVDLYQTRIPGTRGRAFTQRGAKCGRDKHFKTQNKQPWGRNVEHNHRTMGQHEIPEAEADYRTDAEKIDNVEPKLLKKGSSKSLNKSASRRNVVVPAPVRMDSGIPVARPVQGGIGVHHTAPTTSHVMPMQVVQVRMPQRCACYCIDEQ